jgi:caffeoyl-CoA O-methyltransferase
MEFIHPSAEKYVASFSSQEDELLQQINEQTQLHAHAHMLSGQVQGNFLTLLSTLAKPKYILEIGTFTGYSALCLAKGLVPDGELHTIEIREEDAAIAKENFKKSKHAYQLNLHFGNALSIIPTLPYEWDIVFIDADKTAYIEYYEMIVPKLNKDGIIIADNVLFHGQVLEETIKGKNAIAIHAFNEHVANDNRTEKVLLTIRDGLSIIRKK